MGWFEVSFACVVGVVLWLCSWGSIICRYFAWFAVMGFRMVICSLINAISRMQDLFDIPHVCGWFVVVMLGSAFFVYWFVPHKYNTPLARCSHVVAFDSSNRFMLMPVVLCMAFASSLFPILMRNIKASSMVCIQPHSVVVSSCRPLGDAFLLLNTGLNSRKDLQSFLNFSMVWDRVSVLAGSLSSISLKRVVGSMLCSSVSFVVISHAAAAQCVSLRIGVRQLGLWHSAMIRVRFVFASFFRRTDF